MPTSSDKWEFLNPKNTIFKNFILNWFRVFSLITLKNAPVDPDSTHPYFIFVCFAYIIRQETD